MPRRARKHSRFPKRRKYHKKAKMYKKVPTIAGPNQFMQIIETREAQDLVSNAGGIHNFTLSQFPRAQLMSGMFRFYRAVKVIWQYEPAYNTFQEGTGFSKPYIYLVMNRDQNTGYPQIASLQDIQACGARPRALTGKVKLSYKPNWCSPGLLTMLQSTGGSIPAGELVTVQQNGLQCQYGWLATPNNPPASVNPVPGVPGTNSTTDTYQPVFNNNITDATKFANAAPNMFPLSFNNVTYNGHTSFIDQALVNGNPLCCRLTATVVWQFKGAKWGLNGRPSSVDEVSNTTA